MFATYTLPSAVRGILVHMIRSDQSCYYSMSFEWTVCVHLKYKDINVKGSSVLEKGITGQIGSFVLLLHTDAMCLFCRIVKLSSPNINNVLLLGCVLTYSSVFMKTIGISTPQLCKVRLSHSLIEMSGLFHPSFIPLPLKT